MIRPPAEQVRRMTRLWVVIVTSTAGPLAPAADVVSLTGQRTTGSVVEVAGHAVTVIDAGGVKVAIPTATLASIEFGPSAPPPAGKFDELELIDGSVLRVTQVKVKGKGVEVTPVTPAVGAAPAIEVPLGAVFWLLRGADDAARRTDWAKLLAGRGKRDLVVVRSADGLNPLPGTVISGTDAGDAVVFEREDGTRSNVRLTRASGGIVFNQPPRDVVPPTICRVIDRAGNRLVAQAVAIGGGGLKVTTVAGAIVTYPDLAAVEKLDFRQGNVAYLSDLDGKFDYPPVEADGLLGDRFPFAPKVGRDKAVFGGDIVLDGRKFARGVSVPPDVIASYPLGGNYREFRATVGIQDGPSRAGWAVRLRVELDGRPVLDEVVKKADKPRELAVNVKDAKELRLVVERTGLFAGDQLNLADARVQK